MNKLLFLSALLTCGVCGAAESLRDNALEILPLGEAALASQRADGDFGPRKNNWWANMLPLGYLRADAPGRAIDPPHSPVDRAVCTAEETVTLVPLSDSQLRIALLPWVE